jgi:hypothetical protein
LTTSSGSVSGVADGVGVAVRVVGAAVGVLAAEHPDNRMTPRRTVAEAKVRIG